MTKDQLKAVWKIVESARSVTEDNWREFVSSLNADPAVAAEALRILESRTEASEPAAAASSLPPVAAGQQLGRYQLVAVLGHGGAGDTWSAWDVELERTVALKFLRPASSASDATGDRFVREAKAASALNHPNIVTVYEVVRSEGAVAIAMELVGGEVLRKLCGVRQPWPRVASIGAQIASALAAVHAANILHRDIKPENVILRSDGYIKILDFGLAKPLDAAAELSHPGLPVGTFRYMSPEQSQGQKLTGAADVYSFGVVLYELAAGAHPFPAENPVASMIAAHWQEATPLKKVDPAIPAQFSTLVAQMLSRDPARRPTAAQAAERLSALNQEAAQQHHTLGRRAALSAGAAVAASALGAAGWFGLRSSSWLRHKGVPALEAVRLSADPGQASEPSLSPDGNAVAYVSHRPGIDSTLFIQHPGGGEPVAVTSGRLTQGSPTWSPDGRQLAYLQMIGLRRAEIRIVPATGGPGRKIGSLMVPQAGHTWFPGPSLRWSPDPSWLAVSAQHSADGPCSIWLIHAETGAMRRLTNPDPGIDGDNGFSFSPDGRRLAFTRLLTVGVNQLFALPLDRQLNPAGPPRRIDTGKSWNASPDWISDGELVFSHGDSRFSPRLVRQALAEGSQPAALPGFGEFGWYPSISRNDHRTGQRRFVYVRRLHTNGIWKLSLAARGGGRPSVVGQPVQLIPPQALNAEPCWSPDGRRFAFTTTTSGYQEVWSADRDGGDLQQLTHFQAGEILGLSWGPDGRLVFAVVKGDSRNIYTLPLSLSSSGQPQLLLPRRSAGEALTAPDGKTIVFTPRETSSVWMTAEPGAEPALVTDDNAFNLRLSPDGQTLYYVRIREGEAWVYGINLRPGLAAAGRLPRPVVHMAESFFPGHRGIYFVPLGAPQSLAYQDLATGAVSSLYAPAGFRIESGMSVAPDESSIIYASRGLYAINLFVVDGFGA